MSFSREQTVIESALLDISHRIWETMLGSPVVTLPNGHLPEYEKMVAGTVTVSGAWNGTVTVSSYLCCAEQLALLMFDQPRTKAAPPEWVEDVMKEVANMTGGNLKTVLPEPCALTVPKFYSCGKISRSKNLVGRHLFVCGEGLFEIAVGKKA